MKYQNASKILPESLVKELQQYVDGEYLYVPSARHKQWGEISGYHEEIENRNKKIKQEYSQGTSIDTLADRYFLSAHSIRKIIYNR